MRRRHHPKAGVKKDIDIVDLSVQRLRTLDPEPAADDLRLLAGADEGFQISSGFDQDELPA